VAEDVVHPRVVCEFLVEGFMPSGIHVELVMDTKRLFNGWKVGCEVIIGLILSPSSRQLSVVVMLRDVGMPNINPTKCQGNSSWLVAGMGRLKHCGRRY
jgi:hypothetical protein